MNTNLIEGVIVAGNKKSANGLRSKENKYKVVAH
jgi:hypothetical protein